MRGSRREVATGSGTTMPIIADATNSTNDEPPAKCCKYCEGMPRTYLHTTQTFFCIYIKCYILSLISAAAAAIAASSLTQTH